MKIKFCLVASASGFGGGEKNLYDIAAFFSKKEEFEVYAVCPEDGLLIDRLKNLGIKVILIEMSNYPNVKSIKRLRQFFLKNNINLIHAHGTRAALYARIASHFFANIPCVYTIHGLHYVHYDNCFLRMLFLWGERFLKRWTSAFVCVCESDRNKCKGHGIIDDKKTYVIYNGLAQPRKAQQNEIERLRKDLNIGSKKCVLHAARFHYQKGQRFLMQAIYQVLAVEKNVKFLLVGSGEELNEIKKYARVLGLTEENVLFTGKRDDIELLMQSCDIFVLSSLWEGLPYSIVEAMAAAKPIVSTNVDGIPEAVVDNETGLLVKPRDPNALAEALLRLVKDDDLRLRFGRAGYQQYLDKFSIDLMFSRLSELYIATAKTPNS